MDRATLQKLSRTRIREARTLISNGHFEGGYYLAGYAAECALKACIAKQTRRFEFPDRKTVISSYSHNPGDLLKVAGLEPAFTRAPADLKLNWNVVKDWSEETRYESATPLKARELYTALTQRPNGVLTWLRLHW